MFAKKVFSWGLLTSTVLTTIFVYLGGEGGMGFGKIFFIVDCVGSMCVLAKTSFGGLGHH